MDLLEEYSKLMRPIDTNVLPQRFGFMVTERTLCGFSEGERARLKDTVFDVYKVDEDNVYYSWCEDGYRECRSRVSINSMLYNLKNEIWMIVWRE